MSKLFFEQLWEVMNMRPETADTQQIDLHIGAQVYCRDGACGKLIKVVVDPNTKQVRDLIVEKGFLQKQDRVLPVSIVEAATPDEIHVAVASDKLRDYPEYREADFALPAPEWEGEKYGAGQVLYWPSPYGPPLARPVPMIRQRVREGIPSSLETIGRGTPVRNVQGPIGKVDHVLVDPQSREIAHLVVRRGLLSDLPILPVDRVKSISERGILIEMDEEELQTLPRYWPPAEADILAEIGRRLNASPLDLGNVKATLQDGVVTLRGTVRDLLAQQQAEKAARSVEGVLGVESELDIGARTAPSYRRILVPLDGSQRAEKVLPLVKMEAGCHEATIVVLRVVTPLEQGLMLVPTVLQDLKEQAMQAAEEYVEIIATQLRTDGLHVETEVLFGPAADTILTYARERGCDLIVIGSHGRSGARDWRFGQVANKIVKIKADMPVLVVNT